LDSRAHGGLHVATRLQQRLARHDGVLGVVADHAATQQELRARVERWMRDTADPRVDPTYDAWDKYPYFGGAVVDKDGKPLLKGKGKTKP
jgi:hypothetical protein